MFGSLMDENREQANAFVSQAVNLPIQQYAFNATVSSTTLSEIMTVVSLGQRPLALMIMSPTMAKSLALSLLERVKEYESFAGVSVKSLPELNAVRAKLQAG